MDAGSTGGLSCQRFDSAGWRCVNTDASTQGHMDELITYLQRFAECYKDDPEGLADDFRLVVGYSFDELCDKLNDEIVEYRSC